MMKTPAHNTRRTALRDLRVLITTLSLTVVIGLWNLFSRQAQQEFSSTGTDNLVNAGPAPTGEDSLPPLPTLVPMEDIVVTTGNSPAAAPSAVGTAPLREVTSPTPVIIQNRPPVVERVQIGQQPDAGNDEPAPKPAARTGSSK